MNKNVWLQKHLAANETKLIRYVMSLVHDLDMARDIVQDSFLKLWEQNPSEMDGHETQWLFTVSRNRAYDLLRQKKTQNVKHKEIAADPSQVSFTPEDHMVNHTEQEMLQEILTSLTNEQQEVLRLKFQQDLSYKEISAITGMTVNHVGVLIHNTVTKLKEAMRVVESRRKSL